MDIESREERFGTGPSVKSDVVTLSQDTDDWISYSELAIGADAKITKLSWAAPQNGEPRPMRGMPVRWPASQQKTILDISFIWTGQAPITGSGPLPTGEH